MQIYYKSEAIEILDLLDKLNERAVKIKSRLRFVTERKLFPNLTDLAVKRHQDGGLIISLYANSKDPLCLVPTYLIDKNHNEVSLGDILLYLEPIVNSWSSQYKASFIFWENLFTRSDV